MRKLFFPWKNEDEAEAQRLARLRWLCRRSRQRDATEPCRLGRAHLCHEDALRGCVVLKVLVHIQHQDGRVLHVRKVDPEEGRERWA